MADVEPLHALHYDLAKVGGLQPVAAPPYDVIDAAQRAELLGRSPYNVVEVDLRRTAPIRTPTPPRCSRAGATRGSSSATTTPALWALAQDYTGPDGQPRTRHGVFARVQRRGLRPRPDPPARAHAPGPEGGPAAAHARHAREPLADLQPLRRPVATPPGRRVEPFTRRRARGARSPTTRAPSQALARRGPDAIAAFQAALSGTELLIADGHHRYETARVYQQEEPSADHVLMCLVALQDEGLTVFPTHRLRRLDADMDALNAAIERDWTTEPPDTLSHRLLRRRRRADALPQGLGDRRRRARGQAGALPPARHRRARGADPQGRARA